MNLTHERNKRRKSSRFPLLQCSDPNQIVMIMPLLSSRSCYIDLIYSHVSSHLHIFVKENNKRLHFPCENLRLSLSFLLQGHSLMNNEHF